MNRIIPIGTFCIMLLLEGTSAEVFAEVKEFDEFMNSPDSPTYEQLVQRLSKCANNEAKTKCAPTSKDIRRLQYLIESGNPYAADVAFLLRRLDILSGGDLEDTIRSLGLLAETEPDLLLSCVKKYGVSGASFESTFLMLPLETVDDLPAKINHIKRRIARILAVNDPSLNLQKEEALSVLKRRLEQLH